MGMTLTPATAVTTPAYFQLKGLFAAPVYKRRADVVDNLMRELRIRSSIHIPSPLTLSRCRHPLINHTNTLYQFKHHLKETLGRKIFNRCYGKLDPSDSFSYTDAEEINLCVAMARFGSAVIRSCVSGSRFDHNEIVEHLTRVIQFAEELNNNISGLTGVNYFPQKYSSSLSYSKKEKSNHITLIGLARAILNKGALRTILPLCNGAADASHDKCLLTAVCWKLCKRYSPIDLVDRFGEESKSVVAELTGWCFFALSPEIESLEALLSVLRSSDLFSETEFRDILLQTALSLTEDGEIDRANRIYSLAQ